MTCLTHMSHYAMDGSEEQRVCIQFCVKLRKTATDTLEMLNTAFGDEEALCRSFMLFSCFRDGQTSVDDNECSGVLFVREGVVHHEFVPLRQTVNQAF